MNPSVTPQHAAPYVLRSAPAPALARAAAELIAYGCAVFPVAGKIPFGGSHGHKDATRDLAVFMAIVAAHPGANLAVATGPVSGELVGLDLDTATIRAQLEAEHGPFPPTPTVLTHRAEHLWFRSDRPLRGRNGFRESVDVKACGGFLVAPPSRHPKGGVYRWAPGASLRDLPLAPLPAWIADELDAPTVGGPPPGEVLESILGRAFHEAGYLGGRVREGIAKARCPWESAHTCGRRFDGSTVVFGPSPGSTRGWFCCQHAHCAGRRQDEILAALPGRRP